MKHGIFVGRAGVAVFLCVSLLSGSVLAADNLEEPDVEETEDEQALPEQEEALAVAPETEEVSSAEPEAEDVISEEIDKEINRSIKETTKREGQDAKETKEPEEPAVGTVVKNGDCGYVRGEMFYTVTYVGDGHYQLTISGTGKMLLISVYYGAPWYKYSEDIVEIEIQEGVNGIREHAFRDCDQVTSITIPASVNYIEKNAFKMKGLRDVYFLGSYSSDFQANAFAGTTDLKVHCRTGLNWPDNPFTGLPAEALDPQLTKVEAEAPTCTQDGHPLYYYSPVWEKYFRDEAGQQEIVSADELVIKAFGHTWNEGEVTLQPTGTLQGVLTYTCMVCQATYEAAIPATGIVDDGREDEIQKPAFTDVIADKSGDVSQADSDALTEEETAQKVSAGTVKTGDETAWARYLILLLSCGGVVAWTLRKRI